MRVQFTSSSIGMDVETYTLEINTGGQVQIHTLQTLPMMAAQQFQNLLIQAARTSLPCKIRIARQEEIWSQLDQKFKNCENALEFRNNTYGNKD